MFFVYYFESDQMFSQKQQWRQKIRVRLGEARRLRLYCGVNECFFFFVAVCRLVEREFREMENNTQLNGLHEPHFYLPILTTHKNA